MQATITEATRQSPITHTVRAVASEPDNNDEDNTEMVQFSLSSISTGGRVNMDKDKDDEQDTEPVVEDREREVAALADLQQLEVERQPFSTIVTTGDQSVTETLIITNTTEL